MFESIETFAAAVEASALAKALKFSPWAYGAANTAHVIGVAMLFGAVLPMDLRLMGLWGRIDRTDVVRILFPIAALGLVIALAAGAMLFSVRAENYAQVSLFLWKFALIGIGGALALIFHARAGFYVERASARLAFFHGAASLVCWTGALVCGRMIAYFPFL